MLDYQKDIWAALSGSDPREMKIIMNGRQIGKSVMAQMWTQTYADKPFYTVVTESKVDDANWFTIKCSGDISEWIKTQSENLWYEHIDKDWQVYRNIFDIHEKIYTMMQLKYSDGRI